MASIRVYQLANSMGLDSKVLLNRLNEMGERKPSASSVLSPDLSQRLRESLLERSPIVAAATRPRLVPRPQQETKVVYRGPLHPIEKAFLDRAIVPRHSRSRRNPDNGRCCVDEVDLAQKLSVKWGGLLDYKMTPHQIVAWSQVLSDPLLTPSKALALHERGVMPHDVGWHHDTGHDTLADRYASDRWTLDQVVTQVEWWREHPESA